MDHFDGHNYVLTRYMIKVNRCYFVNIKDDPKHHSIPVIIYKKIRSLFQNIIEYFQIVSEIDWFGNKSVALMALN